MKKAIFLFVFFSITQLLYSQQKKDLVTISYENINLISIFEKIETITDYKFYFDKNWIDSNVYISGNYNDRKLDYILSKILEGTDLNYFLDSNSIIITKNNIIHEPLAQLVKKDSLIEKRPIFYQEQKTVNGNEENDTELSFIGKENTNSLSNSFKLTGIVKNIKNGEPVAEATIKVKNTNNGTTTDSNGFYSLIIEKGVNIIEIESFDFKTTTRKIILYSDGNVNINLKEKIKQLKEVLIKSRKRRQNTRTAIAGVTTIQAEGVKNMPLVFGERDVLKMAQTLPGIKTTGEGSAGFNVRGGKDDQNLFLLDNATLYNPSHFFGFFSALNPYSTNKVDIYKGGIPPEFGGRLSSVFDISTKKGDTEKLKGEAGIGPATSNAFITTPVIKDKSSLIIGARATYSGWILKSLKDEQLKKSKASFYDLVAKYNHKINVKNEIESTIYYSKDAFSISSDSIYKYSNRLVSLNWNHTFNSKNTADLTLTNSEYKFNINFETIYRNSFDYNYKINESQIILKNNYHHNDKNKIKYGLSSKLYNINPGEKKPVGNESLVVLEKLDNEKALESAIFIAQNYKVTKKLMFDIGLRYSIFMPMGESKQNIYEEGLPRNTSTLVDVKEFQKNEIIKTYTGLEPRLAIKYDFGNNFMIKAGYDKTNQYLHLLSTNTTQSPTDTWKLSNLNIKPQTSQQFSLGFFKTLNNDELELSIEGYYKKSKNILDYKVGANVILNENLEMDIIQGKGKAYGAEFLVKKQLGKLNGWIGYTYSRTFIKMDGNFSEEKINDGKYFPANFDKPHDFSTVLNYKLTHRYSFSANFVYQTGRPITFPVGKYTYGGAEYTLYSDRNKYRIPDYYRLDLGVNIEGNHKIKKLAHSFWNISVYNVLGRNNPYSIYFVTEKGQVKAYKTSIFGIPVPTITYNFKF